MEQPPMDETDLTLAWKVLDEASDIAADHLGQHPSWDLVYVCLGHALLTIQAATDTTLDAGHLDAGQLDAVPTRDPFGVGGADASAGAAPVKSGAGAERSCLALITDAAQLLRGADLGATPGLAVAINAVADAHRALQLSAA